MNLQLDENTLESRTGHAPLRTREHVAMPARQNHVETAHGFGDGLVGVITRPLDRATSKIGVLLLNAGLTRHTGPFRMHVELARRLAAEGFAVLRFDQSGLGDSALPGRATGERRQREIDAAMRLLAHETGVERFVLCGLCSGADDAFHVGAVDARVAGAILLDGVAYPTPGFWMRHALPRLFDFGKVLRFLMSRRNPAPSLSDFRDWPERSQARRMLAGMVARDLRLLFVFTGGAYHYFNHRAQLAASLGHAAQAPQVSLEFWREYDHTFFLRKHRAVLFKRVVAWMLSEFGADATKR
ncbi:serine aminopeptidase domain-containing protein [Lysobacter arvi]|uniref:Alpha/beta hydrolase n=1 Tax=Lysobacter arvi TaxID=3038776 RepID=A0ABU1CBN1_9GAMM|nr:alpha/beta hydrolase [Lysobacter arvi]MDR0182530.1 alpha/beta hydrolase [Lysobacter arvi]